MFIIVYIRSLYVPVQLYVTISYMYQYIVYYCTYTIWGYNHYWVFNLKRQEIDVEKRLKRRSAAANEAKICFEKKRTIVT